jgi:gluconate 5-dehydrogenase
MPDFPDPAREPMRYRRGRRRLMASDLFSLDGKIILVTGASRGLGRAMAAAMAEAGGHVVLNGRDRAALDAAAGALREAGGSVEIAAFDVTDEDAVKAAIEDIVARHGRLDVLVGNAGIQHRRPLLEFGTADWQRVLDTNLTACFVLAREAARPMIAQGSGRIILTASMMGPAIARPTVSAYIAAKGGLVALTKALAVELGPHGIACNAIAPGYFATEMNAALLANEEFTAFVGKRTPLGRWGRSEEIGGVAVFLASAASSYVNGHALFVDGGLTASI